MQTKLFDPYPPVLFLVAVTLHLAVTYYVPLEGHSYLDNTLWVKYFTQTLFSGQLYPRWLPQIYAGCGSPVFFFYFPIPFYVTSFLSWMPGPKGALVASYTLVHALSCLAFYGWSKSSCTRRDAAIAALIYLLMPYAWIDMYNRSAYTEFFSFLWLPLLMRFTDGIVKGERRAIFLFGITYALQIMSSLHMALIGSLLIFVYVLVWMPRERRIATLASMAAAVAIGLTCAAIYLLPLAEGIRHIRLFSTDETFSGAAFDYRGHFFPGGFFPNYIFVLIVLSAHLTLRWRDRQRLFRVSVFTNRSLFFWFMTCCLCLFMMMRISSFLLVPFPFLTRLQFPWRFSMLLSLCVPRMVSLMLSQQAKAPLVTRRFRYGLYRSFPLLLAVCVFVILSSPPHNGYPLQFKYDIEAWANEYLPSTASVEWLLPNSGTSVNDSCSVKKVWPQTGKIGALEILAWQARDLHFGLRVTRPGTLLVGQFNFPYWKAYEGDKEIPIETSPEGLIALQLPPGAHDIHVEMGEWKSERYGKFLSLAGILIALGGVVLYSKQQTSDSASLL